VSIPALLKGCVTLLRESLGEEFDVGERPLDGAPIAAYNRPSGWYVSVYFAGAQLIGGESFASIYTLGVDLTRSVPLKKTADTKWFLQDGEFLARAHRISQLLCSGRGLVANVCTAALAGLWEEGRGRFYEQFHSGNMGRVVEKSPDWLAGVPGERQKAAILVIPMTFTGVVWRMNLENTWGP